MRAHLRQFVRSYRRTIISLGTTLFVLVFVIAYGGFYPIIVVNGNFVTARRFNLHLQAAEQYESGGATTSTARSVLRNSNLAVSVLSGLIEEELIEQGARAEFKERLELLRKERVRSFLDKTTVIESESQRYGMSIKTFEKEILRPQVTRDLLTGRLFLKSLRLEDWLKNEKKIASVAIFSRVFYWSGEEVKVK